jgi:nitronate monooxygenase
MSRGNDALAARAMGADLAYLGTRFIATQEANAPAEYKQMLIDSSAADIIYTNLFSGVHGSYLKDSIINAGFDPDNLPEGNLRTMNFGTAGKQKAKAWRDIWSAGQGVGTIDDIPTVAELVDRMTTEYLDAANEITCAQ